MSKLESTYLKGWAVLFMMFLHFGNTFVAPEYQYSWSGNEWEGAFQICVPIFLFPVFVIGTPKFQDWVAISIKS